MRRVLTLFSVISTVALLAIGATWSAAHAGGLQTSDAALQQNAPALQITGANWQRLAALQLDSLRSNPGTVQLAASQAVTPTPPSAIVTIAPPSPDATCLACHVGHQGSITFPSGEELPVGVDPAVLSASVHGSSNPAPVYCTDCHTPKQDYQFPHAPNEAQSLHDFQSDIAQSCEGCHTSAELHNPGHTQAEEGANVPNCVDCHGGHDVEPVEQSYAEPVAYCQGCHAIGEMEDEQVRRAHEDVVANLAPGENCQTCHADQPLTQSQQCEACHSRMTGSLTFADGDQVSLKVDQSHIDESVHGNRIIEGVEYPPLQCTDCHQQMAEAGFPHPRLSEDSRVELRLRVEQNCVTCHEGVANSFADGVHAHAIREGELNAASCADCHGSHDIQPPNEPRTRISDTCGTCHEDIFMDYRTSVHGSALYDESNPDVPVCTDCHGVHDIANTRQASFRLSSPQMCGECHANKELMSEYGISTEVFETYVADFHGSTVTLFAHGSPDEPTNKAVCYDCHGIHDISRVDEGSAEEIQARLLATCQKCHPDATESFPASWMGHYVPSMEHYPLVYLTNLFYLIMMPAVIGGFLLFIGSDIFRRATDWYIARRKRRS